MLRLLRVSVSVLLALALLAIAGPAAAHMMSSAAPSAVLPAMEPPATFHADQFEKPM